MRDGLLAGALVILGLAYPFQPSAAAERPAKYAKAPVFMNKAAYATTAGKPIVIYGSRSGDCDNPPSFRQVKMIKAGDPGGKVFDAGVGWRPGDPKFCPNGRPVRLITYQPSPGFKGTAAFTFWGSDTVKVNVK